MMLPPIRQACFLTCLLLSLLLGLCGSAFATDSRVVNALLDGVLEADVKDGYVDYPAVARNVRFYKYLEAIAEFDAEALGSDEERLAFWINAYNALAIKSVIDGITPVSMTGKIKFFRTTEHRVAGRSLDLQSIRDDILRKLGDPRVHFALVPASYSAPKLRSESFRADELDRQLDGSARDFLNDKRKNRYSAVTLMAKVSTIFEEYAEDFGEDERAVLRYIAQYIDDEDLAAKLKRGAYGIEYMEYDHSINGRPMN